jgi:hypothetical protein
MMILVGVLSGGSLIFIIFSMVRSISDERDKRRGIMREFGLSIALMALFFITWFAHGVTQWQTYTDEQQEHGESASLGDFAAEFGQATLENWQSEFLQLFSFVTLAALYIHKGSAESKDGEEKIEASLRRLEEKMGTLPDNAPTAKGESWKLPDTPLVVS